MELQVYNKEGKKTEKKVKLNPKVFCIEPNTHAIYLDVKQHLANRRQGTHETKERGQNDIRNLQNRYHRNSK